MSSTWPRRRSRTTCRASCPSSRSLAGPRPPPTWPGTRRHPALRADSRPKVPSARVQGPARRANVPVGKGPSASQSYSLNVSCWLHREAVRQGEGPEQGGGPPACLTRAGRPTRAGDAEGTMEAGETPPPSRTRELVGMDMTETLITLDGNEAAARVAHRLSEVIAIYPITPPSPMGELADALSASGRPNLWGAVPQVIEMQSEAGAAGALHGALQAGALCTTFTASQGLPLMIPNMYKISGELSPPAVHAAARTLATRALSIFGDQSDVMAVRQTGWAMLASSDVQAAQDLAAVAHAATLESRVPFLHFFDGFRTSHEVNVIRALPDDVLRALMDDHLVRAHRERALSPDHPVLRGSAQNPDVFFQAREASNPFHQVVPQVVQWTMDRFAELTGRAYHLFDYHGAPDAERIVVLMGSGNGAVAETVDALLARGEKVGAVNVRLFRPFDASAFVATLPPSVRSIAVLDRTKEPGAPGEPVYQDVMTGLGEALLAGRLERMPRVIGGRYGLASKEFDPAMAKAVFDELAKDQPKNHFTVGIVDDVTHTSLDVDRSFSTEASDVVRAVFYGLGADGTVSANKSSVKIIGEGTDLFAQGYFVYDSKKACAMTVSHLRFGPREIRSSYLIGAGTADFVACHQFGFLERQDVLELAAPGATFLLNSPFGPDVVWYQLPL